MRQILISECCEATVNFKAVEDSFDHILHIAFVCKKCNQPCEPINSKFSQDREKARRLRQIREGILQR